MKALNENLAPIINIQSFIESKTPSILWRVVSSVTPVFRSLGTGRVGAILLSPKMTVLVTVGVGVISLVAILGIAYLLKCTFDKKRPEEGAKQQFLNEQKNQLESISQVLSDQIKDHENIKLNDQQLNQVLRTVDQMHHYLHNQEVLRQLKEQVITEYKDEQLLDQVLNQLDFKEYLTGQRRLGEETKTQIIDCVRSLYQKQAGEEFDQLLEKVRIQAKRDLFLNDPFIETTFNVTEALKPFSPEEQKNRREGLQKIINQAYVNRELKQKGKLTMGEEDEISLLSCLGVNVRDNAQYQDKEFVYKMLQEIVRNQLRADGYTGSLKEMKEMMKTWALTARLKAAGLEEDSLQVNKFQKIYPKFQDLKKELTDLNQKIELTLPENFPLDHSSLSVQALQQRFKSLQSYYICQTLELFFKNSQIREKFQDEYLSVDSLCTFIDTKHPIHLKRDRPREKCLDAIKEDSKHPFAQEIAFHQKWGKYLKAEMIQGFSDPSEALGAGICWGVCQRICFYGQTHPDISVEEFAKKIEITPQDRFFQGAYQINNRVGDKKQRAPQPIEKAGFQSKAVLTSTYDANEHESILTKYTQKQEWENSAGWSKLGLSMAGKQSDEGHAILLRWDIARQRFWIFDPNVGLLCFEEATLSLEDKQKSCSDCLKELIAHFYPTTFQLSGRQLVH